HSLVDGHAGPGRAQKQLVGGTATGSGCALPAIAGPDRGSEPPTARAGGDAGRASAASLVERCVGQRGGLQRRRQAFAAHEREPGLVARALVRVLSEAGGTVTACASCGACGSSRGGRGCCYYGGRLQRSSVAVVLVGRVAGFTAGAALVLVVQ